jgi:hypothetical protein
MRREPANENHILTNIIFFSWPKNMDIIFKTGLSDGFKKKFFKTRFYVSIEILFLKFSFIKYGKS